MPEILDPIKSEPSKAKTGKDQNKDVDELAVKREFMTFREEVWFYWVRVIILVAAAFGTIGVVGVYMWHIVGPASCRWLCDTDLTKLKDLAITVVVGMLMSVATTYFFRKNNHKN